MNEKKPFTLLGIRKSLVVMAMVSTAHLAELGVHRCWAQPQAVLIPALPQHSTPETFRLTLDDARQRILANHKLLRLAALNVQGKGHETSAARADYFPKIVGNTVYLHFNDSLGSVVSTQGRPILGIPAKTVAVNVLNQNTSFTNVTVLQPITDLIKVRQGVQVAQADENIAQAQLEKGMRELLGGMEQLYWGLLATQRIRAGVVEGYSGAQKLAELGTVETRTALLEARQALQQVNVQFADLQEQLDILLDLPPSTILELIEPPLPGLPVACADDAIKLAMETSPDLREAAANIAKADAATRAARLDFVPSIAAMGGYTNQTGASYIQQNIGYVGLVGSYTFVDWGKRKNVIRGREHLISMAHLKYRQTQDELFQKTLKAYRGMSESHEALILAQELVELRKEAEEKALPAAQTNPVGLIEASKARTTAEVDYVKADLGYRQAHMELCMLIGR
ncbi:TolC family protein [Isosphaeraceae bacterium EP7]